MGTYHKTKCNFESIILMLICTVVARGKGTLSNEFIMYLVFSAEILLLNNEPFITRYNTTQSIVHPMNDS